MSETTTLTIDYEWTIIAVDAQVKDGELENIIKTIHWRYTATSSDGLTDFVYGAVGFEPPDPTAFIPYTDLTKEQIVSWLESAVDITAQQKILADSISSKRAPQFVTLTPNFV